MMRWTGALLFACGSFAAACATCGLSKSASSCGFSPTPAAARLGDDATIATVRTSTRAGAIVARPRRVTAGIRFEPVIR